MEQNTKKKLVKIIFILAFVLIFTTLKNSCKSENKPKTKTELEQEKKDSIQKARDKKIGKVLSNLEMRIIDNMKNPDSYDLIKKDYDHSDTLNTVKMYIKFRGDNSFGGKSISRVDAIYDFKKDDITIVNQSVE